MVFRVDPFIIGLVMGPTTETSLRQTLMLFKGNLLLIFDRPIAAAFPVVAALFIGIKTLYDQVRIPQDSGGR